MNNKEEARENLRTHTGEGYQRIDNPVYALAMEYLAAVVYVFLCLAFAYVWGHLSCIVE